MNLGAVTPTFESASLAGWKTGVTKPHLFMVPQHGRTAEEAFYEPYTETREMRS